MQHRPSGRPKLEAAPADPLDRLSEFNVVWESPSDSAAGSMPIGNGETGANLWVAPDGELRLLLSRTDAWSEASRLLKLGEVRIRILPAPYAPGVPFSHELRLREGRVDLRMGRSRLTVFVDSGSDTVHVSVESEDPVTVTAELRVWRTERKVLKGEELKSSWTMHSAPESVEVWESADTVLVQDGHLDWYHRNETSVVPLTLEHQGLKGVEGSDHDPLQGRTFGGTVWGRGFTKASERSIVSGQARTHAVHIATACMQCDDPAPFLKVLETARHRSIDTKAAQDRTARWWTSFWSRSHVFIDGDSRWSVPENAHSFRAGSDSGGGSGFHGLMSALLVLPTDWPAVQVKAAAGQGAVQESASPLDPTSVTSKVDPASGRTCLVFEGRGTVLSVPSTFPDGLTLAAWIRPDALGGRIFDKVTPGGSDGFLFDTHGGRLRGIVGDKTIVGPELKVGTWQHVAMTYSAETGALSLFLDGERVAGDGPNTGTSSFVTQAYVLQRYVTACAGRGRYPIKFNGSIFTVEPGLSGGPEFNEDWRRWGDCFWWQNTRFPYASMPARGDREMMEPLYRMFEDVSVLCRSRAKSYYGAEGVYFPETMSFFGTYSNGDYGWDRSGHTPGEVLCPWWQWAWQQGLELVSLMLDDYDVTQDRSFLTQRLLPMARGVLAYYESRFLKGADGTFVITPTQSAETYWHDVVNDTPSVAGLCTVSARIAALGAAPAEDRERFAAASRACPTVPRTVRNGKTVLGPAEKYKDERSNVENTEFYAIWPFRIFGTGREDLETARETFRQRIEKARSGWQYDAQVAAIAGLVDDAKASLLSKAANSNPSHRFPAVWGPNYDWLPDQCHGGNILIAVQEMLMQCVGKEIRILPAWPKDWDVSFKLHAPFRTTVECDVKDGKVVKLKVEPSARRQDVVSEHFEIVAKS
ncbi:MAG: LamG domain-containing protein [Armatimonadetes bacterium]|nr:LamG domain-containing protein [Armatimonadota bacterium]